MSVEQNKALLSKWIEEGWNQGNLDVVDEVYAPNFTQHDPSSPVPVTSAEALKHYVAGFRNAMPDMHFETEDLIAEGDKVVTRLTSFGRHEGDLPGAPATGNEMKMTSITIHRIAGGKLVEKWSEKDMISLLQQIGKMPARELGKP